MREITIRLFAQGRVALHVAACGDHPVDDDGCPNFPCEPTEADELAFGELVAACGKTTTERLMGLFESAFNEAAFEAAVELEPEF